MAEPKEFPTPHVRATDYRARAEAMLVANHIETEATPEPIQALLSGIGLAILALEARVEEVANQLG
jgi:hypothetical protein